MGEQAVAPYIRRIAEVHPDLRVSSARLIDGHGQNNTVLIVNGDLVFRFPRYADGVRRLEAEAALLSRVQPRLPLPVPDPRYSSFERREVGQAFMGYRRIPGDPLWMETLGAINDSRALRSLIGPSAAESAAAFRYDRWRQRYPSSVTTDPKTSEYDVYADEYAAYVAWREQGGVQGDPMGLLPQLLDLLGEVAGRRVLDAGCGEGYLARILAAGGAEVTGIDLSPRLVAMARARDRDGGIDYRVADLSRSLPELEGRFDTVASYLVLNDVEDHRGFAATLARVLKPGGRAVLALNNPYSYVVRKGVAYFASGTTHPCGLAAAGINVSFHHRTLGEYLDAFLTAGLQLARLVDVDHPGIATRRAAGRPLPPGEELPRFMLLAFAKASRSDG